MSLRCFNCRLAMAARSRRCQRCGYSYTISDTTGEYFWDRPEQVSFAAPDYVYEGMEVHASWNGDWVKCRVAVAAGHHARVVNEGFGLDSWRYIADLRIELKDVQALARLQD